MRAPEKKLQYLHKERAFGWHMNEYANAGWIGQRYPDWLTYLWLHHGNYPTETRSDSIGAVKPTYTLCQRHIRNNEEELTYWSYRDLSELHLCQHTADDWIGKVSSTTASLRVSKRQDSEGLTCSHWTPNKREGVPAVSEHAKKVRTFEGQGCLVWAM